VLRDYRSHLNTFLETVTDLECRRNGKDGVPKQRAGLPDRNSHGHGQASLARAPESAIRDHVGGHIHSCILENDNVVFRSPLALHPFATGSGTDIDMLGHWRRSYETDRADRGMVAKGIHSCSASVQQIYDTLWQLGFLNDFDHALHCQRNAFRGLKHEGVPAGDRVGQKPKRNHRGKIEGSDGSNYAQWLAD